MAEKNLYSGEEEKEFFVWINPNDPYANLNANMIGSFVSVSNKDDNLMFLPNEHFSGYISTFQSNLLRGYQAEYNLEIVRKEHFPEYPSRLVATFLFENIEEAEKYRLTHGFHVNDRQLKRGKTNGEYIYSKHDLSWIDFLRSPLVINENVRKEIICSYWQGIPVSDFKLPLIDKTLSAVSDSVYEVLFIGRLDFIK
ncbi:MAG: hypothetical protein ACK40G_01995 [Cytophagaceae bacterium]